MKPTVYKRYLLGLLLVILAFNSVDRLALGLVLQDIKAEFHVSDTQLGLLTGIAFAFFYSIMGLPIARWADRGNRAFIISLTTALWSIAVALCGAARSFVQLLAARAAVAVGEAGCMPPAHSLIADYFERAERPRAVGIYLLGTPLSMVIGYFLAGRLNERYGWREMFVLLATPGVVLALLAWVTLREPRRSAVSADRNSTPVDSVAVQAAQYGVREVCATLLANATFRSVLLGLSVISLFGYGLQQWQPSFFIRSHGMSSGELGTWLAVIYGSCSTAGTYLGGFLASRYAAHQEPLQLRTIAWLLSVYGLLSAETYLATNRYVALALIALGSLGGYMTNAPLFALIQTLVPQRMRAVSIAIIFLFSNLIGLGLGPLLAGALSDAFRPWAGEDSLRYALLALCPGYWGGAWWMWRGSRTVAKDLEALRADDTLAGERAALERRGVLARGP